MEIFGGITFQLTSECQPSAVRGCALAERIISMSLNPGTVGE